MEIFEKCKKGAPTRPRQMEGAVHFLNNIPNCPYTHEIAKLRFTSKHEKVEIEGKIGYSYEIGGKNGIEAQMRKVIEKDIKINYNSKIVEIDELKNEYDAIVAADGYRSRIAKSMGMRGHE